MKTKFITFSYIILFFLLFIACSSDDSNPVTPGKVQDPVISPASDTYNADIEITISCNTADAVIYYTADGTVPDTGSSAYTGAIPLTGNQSSLKINAYAVKQGMYPSNMVSAIYYIDYDYYVKYIDPSAAVSGDGSFDSPYNAWADVSLANGMIYRQKRGTIACEQIDVGSGSNIIIEAYGTGFHIYHNTFYNNNDGNLLIWLHKGDAAIINNIFHSSSYIFHIMTGSELTTAEIYNNYFTTFNPGEYIIAFNVNSTPSGADNITDFNNDFPFAENNIGGPDPLLTDPADGDFTIQNISSPCYHAGYAYTGVATDNAGNAFNDPPSIGALENN